MRRSDHPSRPRAITCCRFSALKTLAIPAAGVQPTAQVNVSAPGAALAGFQVSINGRFWVSTEVGGHRIEEFTYPFLPVHEQLLYRAESLAVLLPEGAADAAGERHVPGLRRWIEHVREGVLDLLAVGILPERGHIGCPEPAVIEEELARDPRREREHHGFGAVRALHTPLPRLFLRFDLDLAPSIVTVSNAGELADGPLVREARDVAVLKPEAEPPEELRLRVPVALRVT